jgi:NTE family protein
LQGGGAHGAFTWGVLDALLEDERLDIEGISGASAGAVNAVALAQGHWAIRPALISAQQPARRPGSACAASGRAWTAWAAWGP